MKLAAAYQDVWRDGSHHVLALASSARPDIPVMVFDRLPRQADAPPAKANVMDGYRFLEVFNGRDIQTDDLDAIFDPSVQCLVIHCATLPLLHFQSLIERLRWAINVRDDLPDLICFVVNEFQVDAVVELGNHAKILGPLGGDNVADTKELWRRYRRMNQRRWTVRLRRLLRADKR